MWLEMKKSYSKLKKINSEVKINEPDARQMPYMR